MILYCIVCVRVINSETTENNYSYFSLYSSFSGFQIRNKNTMPGIKTHCLLCRGSTLIVSTQFSNKHFQKKMLADWTGNCVSSLCQVLELDHTVEPSIQNSSFCPSCHQMIRDMDFFLRTIEQFQKSLSKLRSTAEKLLFKNAAELEYGSNLYSKTVKNIVQSLRLRDKGFKAVSTPSSSELVTSLPTSPTSGNQDANNQATSIGTTETGGRNDGPRRQIVSRHKLFGNSPIL